MFSSWAQMYLTLETTDLESKGYSLHLNGSFRAVTLIPLWYFWRMWLFVNFRINITLIEFLVMINCYQFSIKRMWLPDHQDKILKFYYEIFKKCKDCNIWQSPILLSTFAFLPQRDPLFWLCYFLFLCTYRPRFGSQTRIYCFTCFNIMQSIPTMYSMYLPTTFPHSVHVD